MLLSELRFGSFLSYCPRGDSKEPADSRQWMRALKGERYVGKPSMPMSQLVAARLAATLDETPLGQLLTPTCTLVPVPRSTLRSPGGLWVPLLISQALVERGLGAAVLPCLSRFRAIRKSAVAASEERPKAMDHFETLAVDSGVLPPDEVVLVDDIVTRGATLLAAASRLRASFPATRLVGFAVMRTISSPRDFNQVRDPCVGIISRTGSEVFRRP